MVHIRVMGSYMFIGCLPRPSNKYALRPTITKHASCLAWIGALGLTSIHFADVLIVGVKDGPSDGENEGDTLGIMEGIDEGYEEGEGLITVLTMVNDTLLCSPFTPVAFDRLYGVAAIVCTPTTNCVQGLYTFFAISPHNEYGITLSVRKLTLLAYEYRTELTGPVAFDATASIENC